MLRRKQEINQQIQQIIDALLLLFAFWASYALRVDSHDSGSIWNQIPPFGEFHWMIVVIMPFGPLMLELQGFYAHPLHKQLLAHLRPTRARALLAGAAGRPVRDVPAPGAAEPLGADPLRGARLRAAAGQGPAAARPTPAGSPRAACCASRCCWRAAGGHGPIGGVAHARAAHAHGDHRAHRHREAAARPNSSKPCTGTRSAG